MHKLYQWYKLLHADVVRYPKSERHATGEVLKARTLELIESVWEANALPLPERLDRLDRIQRTLDLMKLLVRLLYNIGVYKQDGYVYREQQLLEIGRMLGSWRKNTRKKLGLNP